MSVMLRRTLAAALILAASSAFAGGMGLGALSGMAEAMQRKGEQDDAEAAQRRIIELQHQREMERMRAEFEYRRRALELEQARQQPPQTRGAPPEAIRQVDQAHPGWAKLVRTSTFTTWMKQQPPSVRELANSQAPADANLLLDLFKRDNPAWAQLN